MAFMAIAALGKGMMADAVCAEIAAVVRDKKASISFFRWGEAHEINPSDPLPGLRACFSSIIFSPKLPPGWSVELTCDGPEAAEALESLRKVFTETLSSTFEVVDKFHHIRCTARVEMRARYGLHARPSYLLVEAIENTNSRVLLRLFKTALMLDGKEVWTVYREGMEINAHSIIEILAAAAERGTQFEVVCEGPEALKALSALEEVVTKDEWFTGSAFQVIEPGLEIA